MIGNAFPGSLTKYHANILEPILEQFATANGSRAHQPPTSYTLFFAAIEKVKTPFLKFKNADVSFTLRPQGADLNSKIEHLCGVNCDQFNCLVKLHANSHPLGNDGH